MSADPSPVTQPPTMRQVKYRAALISKRANCLVDHSRPARDTPLLTCADRWRDVLDLGFALALPEPGDMDAASEQIAALANDLSVYAQEHYEWGEQVRNAFVDAWGSDPGVWPQHTTVAEVRAIVTGAL